MAVFPSFDGTGMAAAEHAHESETRTITVDHNLNLVEAELTIRYANKVCLAKLV